MSQCGTTPCGSGGGAGSAYDASITLLPSVASGFVDTARTSVFDVLDQLEGIAHGLLNNLNSRLWQAKGALGDLVGGAVPSYVAPDIPDLTDQAPEPPGDFTITLDDVNPVPSFSLEEVTFPSQMEITVSLLGKLVQYIGSELNDEPDAALAAEQAEFDKGLSRLEDDRAKQFDQTLAMFEGRRWPWPVGPLAGALGRVNAAHSRAVSDLTIQVMGKREERRKFILTIAAQLEDLIRNSMSAWAAVVSTRNQDVVEEFKALVNQFVQESNAVSKVADAKAKVKEAELHLYDGKVEGFKAIILSKERETAARVESAKTAAEIAVRTFAAQLKAASAVLDLRAGRGRANAEGVAQVAAAAINALHVSGAMSANGSIGASFGQSEGSSVSVNDSQTFSNSCSTENSDTVSYPVTRGRTTTDFYNETTSYNYSFKE